MILKLPSVRLLRYVYQTAGHGIISLHEKKFFKRYFGQYDTGGA